jgi:SAM-dependent methyltransferase
MPGCEICGDEGPDRVHLARETMFGWDERFRYRECGRCGTLHLLDVPSDLGKYYPAGYYAFGEPVVGRGGAPWRWLRRRHYRWYARGKGWLGRLVAARRPAPFFYPWLREAGMRPDSAVLDVGCGNGEFLLRLAAEGFGNLTGIDPYLRADLRPRAGCRLLRRSLDDVEDTYEFIILNHSFEHMAAPRQVFRALHRLLAGGRLALVRTPVAGCHAWRTYGTDWAQLDAPRHLFVHTTEGVRRLAEQAGLEPAGVFYDSNEFQFTASELCRRGVALTDPSAKDVFTPAERERFRAEARRLNEAGQGDQAGFFLRKP